MKHTARLLPILCVCALAACGEKNDEPNKEPTPALSDPDKPNSTAEPTTVKSLADRYLDYVAAFNERDEKRLTAAFAAGASLELADTIEALTGGDAIVKSNVEFWTAMPDTKLEPQIVIVTGNKVAALLLGHGTHTGPMATPAGVLAPTGAEAGSFGIEIVEFDPDGAITKGIQYWDSGLLFAQISKDPAARKPLSKAAESPTVVTANHGAAHEMTAALRTWIDSYNNSDYDGATVAYDGAATLWHSQLTENLVGPVAITAYLATQRKAFPDLKAEVLETWGAGDYLLAIIKYTGTNTGPLARNDNKPTGKAVSIRVAQVFEFDSKSRRIARHWAVTNGLALMGQLGLTPSWPKLSEPAKKKTKK